MCGIVAAAASRNIVNVLIEGLKKLEYRGYVFTSDASALLQVTRNMVYLENGDIAELTATQLRIANANGESVQRPVHVSELSAAAVELGEYQHYMQKEIFEQPQALGNTLEMIGGSKSIQSGIFGADAAELLAVMKLPEHYGQLSPILHVVGLQLLSYHAALVKGTDVDKPRNLAKSVTVE